ncbi:MAG: TlyA family RNA methyltransferase [Ruminococcus sp.]|jgi:23S rRNA (cytidine1920-2'-O)/16S rRNA (cytidine1409-2'-O)-methyltransferase|nr:TlyA family RNA methyltransferase [Ruminococcus sp.]
MRLDLYLAENGFAESREKAKTLIKSGAVAVGGRVITKPAFEAEDEEVKVLSPLKYVSRGGYKLEFALDSFAVDPTGKICMDIGASTGGFTDCLLQRGARRVIAVDVGTAQLHPSLLADPRVVSIEQADFRSLNYAGEKIELFVCDVSFISVTKILPALKNLMAKDSHALILIKPQFEIRSRRKNGIIKDNRERAEAVKNVIAAAEALGLKNAGVKECPFTGKDGNIEYFMMVNL